MSCKQIAVLLLLVFEVGCATVRPITHPSPCSDRGRVIRCQITGYEVWGNPWQIQALAQKCPRSAHVSIDPHGDYGVVRCDTPDSRAREAVALVVVEEEEVGPTTPDLVLTLKDVDDSAAAEASKAEPAAQVPPLPEPTPEVRDQPRVEQPRKAKRKKKRAAAEQSYND